jgi:hypothetical protein
MKTFITLLSVGHLLFSRAKCTNIQKKYSVAPALEKSKDSGKSYFNVKIPYEKKNKPI